MSGELENLPKPKKISQYCGNDLISSCKVFLFIMSDSKLVQIAFIDAASHLPPPFYLLRCHSVRKKIIMLLLHLPLSFSFYSNPGPRTTRPSCHFLGLYEIASSFSKQRKRPLIWVSWRLQIRISHIPIWKQKARPLPKNVINISYCEQHRRLKWGSSRMWDLVSRGREGFLSFTLAPVAKYNQHVGLFRLFSEAAWWRSSCLIHRWP